MKFRPSIFQNNILKLLPIIIGLTFILIIFLNSKSIGFSKYSCNDLTNSVRDINIFKPKSSINLLIDNKLAKKANKACIKQLSEDQTNPQFNFQVAYTYMALKDYGLAKKYLDIAIEKKYPAALYYSWVANYRDWIDYENEYKENLITASESNYFAKYALGFEYLSDAWLQDDPELSKKERDLAVKLFKEIDFFLPAENLLLIEQIKDDILNYTKVKKLADDIEKNTIKIVEEYKRHGHNYAIESLYELSIELGNNGYSNLAIRYIPQVIKYNKIHYIKENFTEKEIIYDRAYTDQVLAFSFYNIGKLNNSEEYWIKAINLIHNHKDLFKDDPGFYANSLNNFGLNYIEMGEFDLALKLFRQSVKEYENLNDDSLWSLMPLVNVSIFTKDDKESQIISERLFNSLIKKKVNLKVYARAITTHISNSLQEKDVVSARAIYNQMIASNIGLIRETDPVSRYDIFLIQIFNAVILTEEKKYEKAITQLLETNFSIENEKFFDFSDYNSLKIMILQQLIELEKKSKNKNISQIIDKETSVLSSHILNYIENLEDFNDEKIKEITGFSSGLLLDIKRKIKNNTPIDNKVFKIIQLLSMTEIDFSSFSVEQRFKNKNNKELKKLQILNYELKMLKEKFSTNDNKDTEISINKVEKEKKQVLKSIGEDEKVNLNFYSLNDFKNNLKSNESFVLFLESNENNRLDENILIRIFFNNNSITLTDLSEEYEDVQLNIKKTLNSVNIVSWPPQDFETVAANDLFEALFKNINLEEVKNENLLIKSNGLISTIPFNILVKNYYNDPKNYETISWLVDENNIISVASFKYFFENKKNRSNSKTFLGIGNPDFKKESEIIKIVKNDNSNEVNKLILNRASRKNSLILDQLPETEDEVKAIANLFSTKNYKLFLSKDASEKKIKKENLKKFSYIVFATHAIPEAESKNAEISGLALSYPNQINDFDNGFLTAKEIMKLDLRSDLVLLSACETATDDQASGRAFSGMVNSFFFAGSNSVIASHWKIESNSTVLITTSFFQNLIDKEFDAAKSLRKSILNFKKNNKEFNHPAFWGAFSVVLNSRQT